MTSIAPHITAFLRERLPLQRGASHHTCESYAYTFQLLFEFASNRRPHSSRPAASTAPVCSCEYATARAPRDAFCH
jgi:hypothetical protein